MSLTAGKQLLLTSAAGSGAYQVSRSLRFNSPDSAYLSKNYSTSPLNNRKITISMWVKRAKLDSGNTWYTLFWGYDGSSSYESMIIFKNDTLYIRHGGSTQVELQTTAVYRDTSAWYHIVLAIDTTLATSTDRTKLFVNGSQITTFSTANYPAQNSTLQYLYPNANNGIGAANQYGGYFDGYIADCYVIDGQQLDPSSFTTTDPTTGQLIPKAYAGTYGTNGFHLPFSDNSATTATTLGKDTSPNGNNWTPNNFSVQNYANYNSAISFENVSLAGGSVSNGFDGNSGTLFNTSSGANNVNATIVFAPSTPITISSSLVFQGYLGASQGWEVRIGTTVLASGTGTRPSDNTDWTVPNAAGKTISTSTPLRLIAKNTGGGGEGVYWNRLVVDGVELVNSTGAGNDSLVDTPTSYGTDDSLGGSVRGNYATLNPLAMSNPAPVLANGNLDISHAATSSWRNCGSTYLLTSGKWYFEVTPTTAAGSGQIVGIATPAFLFNSNSDSSGQYVGWDANSWGYYSLNGNKTNSGSFPAYGSTYGAGSVVGVALDLDNGKIWFSVNGVFQASGNPATGANPAFSGLPTTGITPASSVHGTGSNAQSWNFGQRPFAYTAPSGFKALCDTNLPSPLIAKPSTVMDVLTWTGTGGSRTLTGLGFSPDLVWGKARSAAGYNHQLFDVVRGTGSTKDLSSSLTAAEGSATTDAASYGYLSSFTSDGFGTTTGSVNNAYWNGSSTTYVAWCWDAGSTTVTNTQGSISSQVRANASAGFSIVTYTGTLSSTPGTAPTVGHGLGIKPALIISKSRDNAGGETGNWYVNHGYNYSNFLRLNTTAAAGSISASGGGTTADPTSTVFSTYYINGSNISGATYVAYCFAPVAGYSNAFTYTGNGSTDGPAVWLGFRPRLVLIKCSSSAGIYWVMMDSARNTYNVVNARLFPNTSDPEYTNNDAMDFLANGFKIRTVDGTWNSSGATYIGFAWAESPFQYARAR